MLFRSGSSAGGAGSLGQMGNSGGITLNPAGTLTVDDTVGIPQLNRLYLRPLTVSGGSFNYLGSASGPSLENLQSLTPGTGAGVITLTAGTGQNLAVNVSSIGTVATGATMLLRATNLGTGFGNAASFVSTTAPTFVGNTAANLGAINKGILPWLIVDSSLTGVGTSFATTDGLTGSLFRPLASTEYATSVNYSAVSNLVLSSALSVPASGSFNSVNLASGGGLTIAPMQTLTPSSGGFLLQSGNAGISGGFLASGTVELKIYTPTATASDVSTISSVITGSAGLTKAGAGVLALTTQTPLAATTNQLMVNQGTLRLISGGTNTFVVGVGTTGLPTVVNAGGTLDLNGGVQVVGSLSSKIGRAHV